ncbi:MAG: type III toxin-antitoxin system ToxN/AbiQ family toxin [Clostridiales bacterium]|jgi:protein AbiQ|nr:type III toxin-antitoxin system ToxN/AbiQ family toxin [Clostridiales bacterium]
MRWKIPDKTYLDYLRTTYDNRIPKTEYGESTFKPFFGELFNIGEVIYLTQISHPQPRHDTLRNNKDFIKIYRPSSNRLMTIINLNYMFPIHKSLISDLDYSKIGLYMNFANKEDQRKRISFLNIQLREINKLDLAVKAKDLYTHKYTFPDDAVSKRCFDFKKLEAGCLAYIESQKKETPISLD